MKLRLLVLIGVFAVALALPRNAAACSCMEKQPACEAAWQPGAVFAGKVLAIEALDEPGRPFLHQRRVRLEVIEPVRGSATGAVDVFTGAGDGDCGYAFSVGRAYLIYAYQALGSPDLSVSSCGRTRLLADAAEDLAYLRSVPESGPLGATILGTVYDRDRNVSREPGAVVLGRASGLRIVLDCGGSRFTATTTADGRFTIQGVPAGRCAAHLETTGYTLAPSTPIEVTDPRACAGMTLQVYRAKP